MSDNISILELLHSDIDVMHQVQCGLGDDVRNFAYRIYQRYGFGVHSDLPGFKKRKIQNIFVLNIVPMSKCKVMTEDEYYCRITDLFTSKVIPNIEPNLCCRLTYIFEGFRDNILNSFKKISAYAGLGAQATLVMIVYKDKQKHFVDEEQNIIKVQKKNQSNLFCWYLFTTLVPDFGGSAI